MYGSISLQLKILSLFHSPYEGARTLIDVMDRTISPMGGRLLKRWISLPLKDIQPVNERLDIVQYLVENTAAKDEIAGLIRQVGDLERLISKVAVSRINPREVVQLKRALKAIEPLQEICNNSGCIPLVTTCRTVKSLQINC